MQRQGYPSVVHVWGAGVRADFVPFGDRAVIDPGRNPTDIQHSRSGLQRCGPNTRDRNMPAMVS